MNAGQLQAALAIQADRAALWAPHLTLAAARYSINTPARVAMFVAQAGHESALLTKLEENLNYSAAALIATWPDHFNTVNAEAYARRPQAIANRAYAGRMGNGDEASGDGWKNRGRGLFQLTGAADYAAFSTECGEDLVDNPDLLAQRLDLAAWAAAWEWHRGDQNDFADRGDIEGSTHRLNGGLIGLTDRQRLWWLSKQAYGVA